MLAWSQARKKLPILYSLVRGISLLSALKQGVANFFKYVGASFRKAAVALLLRFVKPETAAGLTGLTIKYIYSALSNSFNAIAHRLCTEQYTPHTTRQRVHEVEVHCTRIWIKSVLGSKSGQTTIDTFFRFLQKDALYHEKYQLGYSLPSK